MWPKPQAGHKELAASESAVSWFCEDDESGLRSWVAELKGEHSQ